MDRTKKASLKVGLTFEALVLRIRVVWWFFFFLFIFSERWDLLTHLGINQYKWAHSFFKGGLHLLMSDDNKWFSGPVWDLDHTLPGFCNMGGWLGWENNYQRFSVVIQIENVSLLILHEPSPVHGHQWFRKKKKSGSHFCLTNSTSLCAKTCIAISLVELKGWHLKFLKRMRGRERREPCNTCYWTVPKEHQNMWSPA